MKQSPGGLAYGMEVRTCGENVDGGGFGGLSQELGWE